MNYKSLILKRRIEDFFISPFVWLGKLIARFDRSKEEFKCVYFFPFYHIGGAEKLHFQIAQATGGPNSIIYFTRKSSTQFFLDEFRKSGCHLRDISKYTDNKYLYFLNLVMRGVVSAKINRQKLKPLVFNGQSNFGYKVSPWIDQDIPQVELIHALNTFSLIRLPFIDFYDASVTVSQEIIDKHKTLYRGKNIPPSIWNKFIYISSKVKLPAEKSYRTDYSADELIALFVGRSTPEKRPAIVSRVAQLLMPEHPNFRFEFMGDVADVIPGNQRQFCYFYGDISDETRISEIYKRAHLLIIPSLAESGPLVFMEAMAHGVAILSTPVGLINLHVHNGTSGYVTQALADDQKVIAEMADVIRILQKDRDLLHQIGDQNIDYAFTHFSLDTFNDEYRALFNRLTTAN